jgi:hypothetical protein
LGQQFLDIKKHLPTLGVGLGLRREIADNIFDLADTHPRHIDWLEFAPENYINIGGEAAENLAHAGSKFSLVSHGVNLSIGSTDELNVDYLNNLRVLLDQVNSPWWSDHLCFTSVNGIYMHDLLPLPLSREAIDHVVRRIKVVQNAIDRPFLIENISFYMDMPGGELTEAQFISEVLEKADCGLLLDVNNVYVNSINRGYDAKEFLNQLPLERTVQIHVAGHKHNGELIIDTHGEAIIEPVYELLADVLPKTGVKAILLERDQNFPEFQELVVELDRIRAIASKCEPGFGSQLQDSKQLQTIDASRGVLLPS